MKRNILADSTQKKFISVQFFFPHTKPFQRAFPLVIELVSFPHIHIKWKSGKFLKTNLSMSIFEFRAFLGICKQMVKTTHEILIKSAKHLLHFLVPTQNTMNTKITSNINLPRKETKETRTSTGDCFGWCSRPIDGFIYSKMREDCYRRILYGKNMSLGKNYHTQQ